VIQNKVEDPLSDEILAVHLSSGDTALLDWDGDKFVIRSAAVAAVSS
jgi:ATP-dependent Clp protease ATP-binding subunit ClpA